MKWLIVGLIMSAALIMWGIYRVTEILGIHEEPERDE